MGAVAGAIAESSPAEALQLLTQHNKTPQSNKHSATQPATRCQAPRAKAEHITPPPPPRRRTARREAQSGFLDLGLWLAYGYK